MPQPIIEVRNLSKHYGGTRALSDVSLSIQPGEVHAICGENGAGKSTLMRILAGIETQYEGEYRLHGEVLRLSKPRDAERAGVGMIHQELNLVGTLSTIDNLFLGREPRTAWGLLDNTTARRRATEILAEFASGVPLDGPVANLRIGDQQLIEIAKALSLSANVMIMDEPTSALSESESRRLEAIIGQLKARGTTILYISHKMDEVLRLADRVTILRDGRQVLTALARETTRESLTRAMVGRELAPHYKNRDGEIGATVLQVVNLSTLSTNGGPRLQLSDVSFTLRQGEILGVAGLLGAGRTELLECLFGATTRPTTGTILMDGKPIRFQHPAEAIAHGVAMVSEDRKLLGIFAEMNVRENMTVAALPRLAGATRLWRSTEQAAAAKMAKELAIKAASLSASINSLSGGNQQKAILARWLLTEPQVLLLDDPTRGIDVGAKAEIHTLLSAWCQAGMAIIFTSSELPELLAMADRVLVLCEGRQTALFDRDQASEQTIIAAATHTNPASVEA